MGEKITIDLKDHISSKNTALVGRTNGENLLKTFSGNGVNLKKYEKQYKEIDIKIPEAIITINKSFFLGVFETRIQELGKEGFQKKYQFETSPHIKNKIDRYVDSGLLEAPMEEILNVV